MGYSKQQIEERKKWLQSRIEETKCSLEYYEREYNELLKVD